MGQKYNIELLVNFPHEGKIEDFDMYGKQDLSLLINMENKRFPIDRKIIKEKVENFETKDNAIIKTKESQANGAQYLNETTVETFEFCLRVCCETPLCNVAVYYFPSSSLLTSQGR